MRFVKFNSTSKNYGKVAMVVFDNMRGEVELQCPQGMELMDGSVVVRGVSNSSKLEPANREEYVASKPEKVKKTVKTGVNHILGMNLAEKVFKEVRYDMYGVVSSAERVADKYNTTTETVLWGVYQSNPELRDAIEMQYPNINWPRV